MAAASIPCIHRAITADTSSAVIKSNYEYFCAYLEYQRQEYESAFTNVQHAFHELQSLLRRNPPNMLILRETYSERLEIETKNLVREQHLMRSLANTVEAHRNELRRRRVRM